jgi:hypothetical protein
MLQSEWTPAVGFGPNDPGEHRKEAGTNVIDWGGVGIQDSMRLT